VPNNVLRIPAGDYGTFFFSRRSFLNPCPDASMSLGGGMVSGEFQYTRPGSAPAGPSPCAGGSCWSAHNTLADPWVAVIDWDDWHGEAVGWTVQQAARPGTQVALFPLQEIFDDCPGIHDSDVVVRLAELVEVVDRRNIDPPRVINMSFGRHTYAAPMASELDPERCSNNRLDCHLIRLLRHLGSAPGEPLRTVLVASSGNDGELLLPGGAVPVVAVGALDLTAFQVTGDPLSSWETPDGPGEVQVLMPGSGHCMTDSDYRSWMAPSGSSFSAALFSGWLSEALFTDPVTVGQELGLPGLWQPIYGAPHAACRVLLRHGSRTISTPSCRAGELVLSALETGLGTCGVDGAQKVVQLWMQPIKKTQPQFPFGLESYSVVAADRFGPTPRPQPCVPCSMSCQIDLPAGGPPTGKRKRTEVSLTLDLHSGWALADEMTIEALYLRFPNDDWQQVFSATPSLLADQLKMISRGQVSELVIKGALLEPELRHQPSAGVDGEAGGGVGRRGAVQHQPVSRGDSFWV